MTINKSNLSTSADGADIFTIGGADSPFINLGSLTTSGDLASPIRGAASGISVTNKGTLTTSGDGSPGVTVGDVFGAHYDNVTVANYGTIATTGNALDDGVTLAFPDGIDTYGNNDKLLNYGTITATSPDGAGMASIGMNCQVINYGTITAGGAGLVVDGIDGSETNNTLINYGQIHTTADGSIGIVCFTRENLVKNYGFIQADGFGSYGISMEAGGGLGENFGTILVTGELSRGVLIGGRDPSFVNYGTILSTGPNGIGARFSGDNPSGIDGGTFTNYGKIVATLAVSGTLADDHFVNHGILVGDAVMGAGDDSYTAGKGGSLSGTLTLGDGDDLIIFEKGGGSLTVTDFVAGAATDDVIDLSAFHFASLADVMSHASQSGSDVVLNLGNKDKIVLEGVSLAALAPDDFNLTGSVALLGQAASAHHDALALV